jgi:hypothetical protein
MKRINLILALMLVLVALFSSLRLSAQAAQPSPEPAKPTSSDPKAGSAYSGMYAFLKEGEFVQVTVEDEGHVTGFISRFADSASDKGAFIDQFFKSGKLQGNNLTFTTEIVHGVAFDFKGTVERGDGKNPEDEGYFVLKGSLSENTTDPSKKITTHAQQVQLKMFPQDAEPAPPIGK